MRTISLFLPLLFFNAVIHAQNNYRVTYKGGLKDHDIKCAVVFNDSICYSYLYITKKDPFYDKAEINTLFMLHGNLYSKKYDCIFSSRYNLGTDHLLFDSIYYKNWFIGTQTKTIAGHECQSAYAIKERTDTAFIFFATDMRFPYGPYGLVNTPGLVLESFDNSTGYYWLAQSVELTKTTPVFPRKVTFINIKDP